MDERGDAAQAKETIILVHGTWAAPDNGCQYWYQHEDKPSNGDLFTTKLDAALASYGSKARCWAHAHQHGTFSWSGDNSWIDRTHAAAALAEQIKALQADNWKCHVVAHSHGGNVLAEALFPAWRSFSPDWQGRLVTLGTPFLDTATNQQARRARLRRIVGMIAWTAWCLFMIVFVLGGIYAAEHWVEVPGVDDFAHTPFGVIRRKHIVYGMIVSMLVSLLVISVRGYWNSRKRPIGWSKFWQQQSLRPPSLLAMHSLFDEAWQLLHHVRAAPNPFAPGVGLAAFLGATRKGVKLRLQDIDKIAGYVPHRELKPYEKMTVWIFWIFLLAIASLMSGTLGMAWNEPGFDRLTTVATVILVFVGMVLVTLLTLSLETIGRGVSAFTNLGLPLRWALRSLASLKVLPSAVVTYFVRNRVWSVVQETACGLEGYRYELPTIDRTPRSLPASCCKYDKLPEAVERRALARRDAWVGEHFGAMTGTFSSLTVTASDIQALLKLVANDLSLVHAAYYTDDECIDRIARWIADKG